MKAYYRLVSEVDATCGRLLKELEAQGLRGNTLVIFTTDNGYIHAERGLADKWYPYEESIRVPLIVRDPRAPQSQANTTNDDFVLSVDLAPFMLKAAGISPPPTMQGRDFAPLYLADKKPDWRTEFYYEHPTIGNKNRIPRSEALVRKDMKYIWWPEFEYEELFDLKRDALEQSNLVRDPAYQEELERLRQRFKELKAQAS
jgi:arylsulfatase A-like enzyme